MRWWLRWLYYRYKLSKIVPRFLCRLCTREISCQVLILVLLLRKQVISVWLVVLFMTSFPYSRWRISYLANKMSFFPTHYINSWLSPWWCIICTNSTILSRDFFLSCLYSRSLGDFPQNCKSLKVASEQSFICYTSEWQPSASLICNIHSPWR